MNDKKFIECDTCRAKPGSPTLCYGCLHNRALIDELDQEIVICSAVKTEAGKIFRGHRHADCISEIKMRGLEYDPREQGFITSKNRFVDRKEGYEIQIKAGIKSVCKDEPYLGGELYSEDLY